MYSCCDCGFYIGFHLFVCLLTKLLPVFDVIQGTHPRATHMPSRVSYIPSTPLIPLSTLVSCLRSPRGCK